MHLANMIAFCIPGTVFRTKLSPFPFVSYVTWEKQTTAKPLNMSDCDKQYGVK